MLEQNQLALDIHLPDDAIFSSFYPGDNQEALYTLKSMAKGMGERFVYLWGGSSVGKSHLLQAACHEAYEMGRSAVYIPFRESSNKASPRLLEDLEKVSLVCLDDIHVVSGNSIWEEAIFHFYNRLRDGRLIVSAETSPLHIAVKLADLKSRLAWGITYQLHLMTDDQKIEALRLRAHCRGLELNKTVAQFLLNHCPRDMQKLFETLEKLDQASLAEQRRLTVPFVKQVLWPA